jgi:hypothetical protein
MSGLALLRKRIDHAARFTSLLLVLLLLSTTATPAVPVAAGTTNSAEVKLSNPVSRDDYVVVSSWGKSYLAVNGQGKKLLYLEGDAYQRGYATGKLCPRSVYRMTHDYIFNLVSTMVPGTLGMEIDPQALQQLLRVVWPLCQVVVMANMDAVPREFLEEMRGVADGCRSEGYDVTWLDVLTLNLGFDVLESLFAGPFSLIACNQFAVFGEGTTDGRLYHGRDFMFTTGGDVFSDEALLIIHKPTRGYPLVASAAPGMVGVPTALNSRGVSCAMDMVASFLTRPIITGEGTLLLCRKAVQFGGSLDEAVALIRDSDRGVPWLFMLADGFRRDAVVLETVASSMVPPADHAKTYIGRLVGGIIDMLFPGLRGNGCSDKPLSSSGEDGEDRLKTLLPPSVDDSALSPEAGVELEDKNGVMERRATYRDPDGLVRLVSEAKANGNEFLAYLFPLQGESLPDLLAMTNHYIIPWRALTFPSTGKEKRDSLWRYETMLGLLLEAYGRIDRTLAMWIIDFLNPARCDYYGTDTTQSVKGHHVLMDNREKEIWSLHGYYDGAWAHVDLDDFLGGRKPRKKARSR